MERGKYGERTGEGRRTIDPGVLSDMVHGSKIEGIAIGYNRYGSVLFNEFDGVKIDGRATSLAAPAAVDGDEVGAGRGDYG